MTTTIDSAAYGDFERLAELEWLETNGIGGWASSTVAGTHSRRYHGLLVAATRPPVGRMVLVSKLEESLHVGDTIFELCCNRYPAAVHPRGYRYLVAFTRGLFPVFEYEVGPVRLRKTVAAVRGENTSLISYQVLAAPEGLTLELRPFITWRDYHALGPAGPLPEEITFGGDVLELRATMESPATGCPNIFIKVPGGSFHQAPDWYYRFEYEIERRRGLDFQEDLWTPGVLKRGLLPGERLCIIVSTVDPQDRGGDELFEAEQHRRQEILARLPVGDDLHRTLGLAADQFVVRRGKDLRTLIAGYHWFGDWGRDTMIALPGLCLATGRHEDARKILHAFARSASRGMLPNRFPDHGETPEYNTADATLWFFVAIHKYFQATDDDACVRHLLPVLRDILAWHESGTRYGIGVDEDGLLIAGEPGTQLTWMDAKVDKWVVTPRQGKAVEINALWFNALTILSRFEKKLGDNVVGERLARTAERVRRRFNQLFWNDELGCLYDVVDGTSFDDAVRPNQIFALSLPFPLLPEAKAEKVLRVVEAGLLTPVGLRSLAANHPDYRKVYIGDQTARDGAYHQGTVWGWLLGPYLTALVRYRGEAGKRAARKLLEKVGRHLSSVGVGTYSEIFDAEPPHTPRGCIAQAWSVGELLRVLFEDLSQ